VTNVYKKCRFESSYSAQLKMKGGSGYTYSTGIFGSKFFKNIDLNNHMSVSFMDYSGTCGLEVTYNIKESPVVFNFALDGECSLNLSDSDTKPLTLFTKQGTSTIRVRNTSGITGCLKIPPHVRYRSIAVHIDEQYLKDYLGEEAENLPDMLNDSLYNDIKCPPEERFLSGINPDMMSAAFSAFKCAKSGDINRLYLSSKAGELICLKLFQLIEQNKAGGLRLYSHEKKSIFSARELLVENLATPISIGDLAKRVGLNRLKLQQGFKKEFGTTIYSYLSHYRMEKALAMLERNDRSVSETAYAVGYSNVSKFISAFKKKYGITPGKMSRD